MQRPHTQTKPHQVAPTPVLGSLIPLFFVFVFFSSSISGLFWVLCYSDWGRVTLWLQLVVSLAFREGYQYPGGALAASQSTNPISGGFFCS